MAENLPDYIERALADFLNASGGGMVTAWHLVAEVIDTDGDSGIMFSEPEAQRGITTLGLIEWARGAAKHEMHLSLDAFDEDD